MTGDELGAAVDTKRRVASPRGRMLDLAAWSSRDARVHDTSTLRTMADGRVAASMIQVIARIGLSEGLHHLTPGLSAAPVRLRA
jgi:hypothetical protein